MFSMFKGAVGVGLAMACLVSQAQFRAILIENSKAWGTAIADYNGDGHDDIYITGHDKNDRIWYWTPTGYVASPQVLQWSDRHDCDAADVNLDGMMDFYCAVGADKGTGSGPKELWMQGPAGEHHKAKNFGADDPYGRGRIPKFFDFNHDGYPDIYLANLATIRDDGQPNINRVFINQHNTTFVEAATIATGTPGSGCVAKGDIDHDGWDDLLVCNADDRSHLFVNNRKGDFVDLALPDEGRWLDAKLTDMNGDGRDDLVLLTAGNRLQILLNSGAAPYFDRLPALDAPLPPGGISLAAGDFDRDGRKDVYVVLHDERCDKTGTDLAPDWIFMGASNGTWRSTSLEQTFAGCGHMADVLDGTKLLLLNGGGDYVGPNYVLATGKK